MRALAFFLVLSPALPRCPIVPGSRGAAEIVPRLILSRSPCRRSARRLERRGCARSRSTALRCAALMLPKSRQIRARSPKLRAKGGKAMSLRPLRSEVITLAALSLSFGLGQSHRAAGAHGQSGRPHRSHNH